MSSTHPQSMYGHERMILPSMIAHPTYVPESRLEPKITLMSRPQQISGPAIEPPIGSQQRAGLSLEGYPGSAMDSAALSYAGRAARGDYFDTEDPSVNLHDFIINSMQSQKNRVILVKLEEEFVKYVQDSSVTEPLKLPPWDSYHRMLAHRVAAYFGLEHNVDPMDKMCVVVHKGPNTRMPHRRFSDCMSKVTEDPDSLEPKHILKRTSSETVDVSKQLESILRTSSDHLSGLRSLKTFEEREEEYERARARIFNQQSPLEAKEPSMIFDLETPSSIARRKSRFLPAIMQHRRAASDTTAFLFNRGTLSDLLKEGPASDHSSRSITPLLSNLNKSTDAINRAVGSRKDLDEIPAKEVSPLTPRKPSQHFEPTVLSHSPPKLSKSIPEYETPPTYESPPRYEPPETVTTPTNTNPLQYQSMQAGGMPVLYQPQGSVIADPNWYPYQQMMVYQVPQSYVPAAHYTPFSPSMYQPGPVYAVNQQFSPVAPGGIAPGAVLTGKDLQMSPGARPMGMQGYEQYSSPTHNPGIALVRPIAQPVSPIRVAGKPMGPWGSPLHQTYVQQPVVLRPQAEQLLHPSLVPYTISPGASQLAEQVESSLHISDQPVSDGASDPVNQGGKPSEASVLAVGVGPVDSVQAVGRPTGTVATASVHQSPVQFVPQQVPQHQVIGGGPEGAFVTPGTHGSVARFPPGYSTQVSSPVQPGPLTFPSGVLQARPPGGFSPSSGGITHSPVQILGHTLGTSLFSPPPSTSSHPALFGQAVSKDHPSHPPIGSNNVPDSPGRAHVGFSAPPVSGAQSLPPRMSVQSRSQRGGTRYQNQRHPSNRAPRQEPGTATVEHVSNGRKDALLPTPPPTQLVKLDTNLTCGVPLHVMELTTFPPEGSPDYHQAIQELKDIGVMDTKTGVMSKTSERVMIAVFNDSDNAMKALQCKHTLFSLGIPGSNHAKCILSLLNL